MDVHLLLKAVQFASIKHKDQRRFDTEKTPYINHPIGVAHILSDLGGVRDVVPLMAAILHDTIEDTRTIEAELKAEFGLEVAAVVMECSDDKSLVKARRKELQIEKAAKASFNAKLVKLADKLHNLEDLIDNPPPEWDKPRRCEYFVWAMKVVEQLKGTNEMIEDRLCQLKNPFIVVEEKEEECEEQPME